MKAVLLSLCFLSILVDNASAQERQALRIIAKAEKDSILIRWAPSTPLSWEEGNEKGYVLRRVTIVRDEKVLPKPEVLLLTEEPLKPAPYESWKVLAQQSEIAIVAAQALYGEKFSVDMEESDIVSVYQKSREEELRYSFSLFAADQSIIVAKALGLYYVDKTAKLNEKYLYQVDIPGSSFSIDSGSVFLGLTDYTPLPQPDDLSISIENHSILLKWKYKLLENYYNSYWVERAEGTPSNFKKITESPVTATFKDVVPQYIYKSDSLPEKEKAYYYRVLGIDAFGQIGPPSDTLKAVYTGLIDNSPVIIYKENIDNEKVLLRWAYPYADSLNLSHFQVYRGSTDREVTNNISENLGAGVFSFLDKNPGITNYYRIAAFDASGKKRVSMPVMVQLIDSIPPEVPKGLQGMIVKDSIADGLVLLTWEQNEDNDIAGYRVYRGNNLEDEFSLITPKIVKETSYTDTIRLDNLSDKVYYKIMAIDEWQNHSALSEALPLIKPDKLPPVPAVWSSVENGNNSVLLYWHPSPSKDVMGYRIYRSPKEENKWNLIYSAGKDEMFFEDDQLEHFQEYRYTLLTVDEGGLESEPAQPVFGKLLSSGVRPKITNILMELTSENHIQIRWNYKEKGVVKYIIYKGLEGEALSYFTSLSVDKNMFIDRDVIANQSYQYKIGATFEQGEVAVSEMLLTKTR